jgi:hypothetical protein
MAPWSVKRGSLYLAERVTGKRAPKARSEARGVRGHAPPEKKFNFCNHFKGIWAILLLYIQHKSAHFTMKERQKKLQKI